MHLSCFVKRWFRKVLRGHEFSERTKSRRAVRLTLDILEDRLAPATLTANSTDDNTTDISVLTLREAITLINNDGAPQFAGAIEHAGGLVVADFRYVRQQRHHCNRHNHGQQSLDDHADRFVVAADHQPDDDHGPGS